jgi:hypothetical protein
MKNLNTTVFLAKPIPVLACSGTPGLAVTSPIHGLRPAGQPAAVANAPCHLLTSKVATAASLREVEEWPYAPHGDMPPGKQGPLLFASGGFIGSSAVSRHTSPAPSPGILVRSAG